MSSSSTCTLALPPMSTPSGGSSPPLSPVSIDEVVAAMAKVQLSKVRSGLPLSTPRGAEFLSSLGSALLTPGRRAMATTGGRMPQHGV
ncbi:hypothetical protein Cni_G25786 [Canna indica]|uniref:Uncharacterized protein n=1 Tax=Canna indica TaxID=4628 RepID=A0AAQ3KXN6_9LILI|nr:hypothetical protein Cni_G25786 [Canna indica]